MAQRLAPWVPQGFFDFYTAKLLKCLYVYLLRFSPKNLKPDLLTFGNLFCAGAPAMAEFITISLLLMSGWQYWQPRPKIIQQVSACFYGPPSQIRNNSFRASPYLETNLLIRSVRCCLRGYSPPICACAYKNNGLVLCISLSFIFHFNSIKVTVNIFWVKIFIFRFLHILLTEL